MSVTIKSQREIALMREAGKILADVHNQLRDFIRPGISTLDIDKKGEEIIRKHKCIPSFLNYDGYPGSICCSINDEVVHGIPNKHRFLKEGDIISLDAGVIYEGYHSDAARTWAVGTISQEAEQLINVTRESFFEAMKVCRAGHHLNEIGETIENYIIGYGYSAVRDLVGHGIGTSLHEDPQICNFKVPVRGIRLQPGMTLAIEPMINMGRPEVHWCDDDWTVVTADGTLSAHYENTILITEDEPEILSLIQ